MPNYSNTKIYGVYNKETNELLQVGATTIKYLSQIHNNNFDDKKKGTKPFYDEIHELTKDGVQVKLFEECSFESKEDLNRRLDKEVRRNKPKYLSNGKVNDNREEEYVSSESEPEPESESDCETTSEAGDIPTPTNVEHKERTEEEKDALIKDLFTVVDLLTADKPDLKRMVEAFLNKH